MNELFFAIKVNGVIQPGTYTSKHVADTHRNQIQETIRESKVEVVPVDNAGRELLLG